MTQTLDSLRNRENTCLVQTRCAKCYAPMSCQPDGACWCKELPPIPYPTDAIGCLCRNCLQEKINEAKSGDVLSNLKR